MYFKGILYVISMVLIWGCVTQPEGIAVTGHISIKGNSPYHYIALHDTQHHKIYKILNAKAYNISKYQNRVLTLRFKLIRENRGVGFPTEVEVIGIER